MEDEVEDDDVEEDEDEDNVMENEAEDDDVEKGKMRMLRIRMLRRMMKRMVVLWKMRCRMVMLGIRMSRGRRIMMLRGRKMMIWQVLIWRRRTGPKTATHNLCEPAQSKCTWTCQKSYFMRKFSSLMPHMGTNISCELAQSKCSWTCQESILCKKMQVKCHGPKLQQTFRATLRSRNAVGHVGEPFYTFF